MTDDYASSMFTAIELSHNDFVADFDRDEDTSCSHKTCSEDKSPMG